MRILLMSSLNPVASKILMDDLFRPSQEQSKNAYLIGYNHKIPEYKLKKTLARDFSHHFDIPYNGQHLVEVEGSKKHVSELNRYASQMARGLFIRNVDGAQPGKVKINWVDRSMLSIKGVDLKKVMNPLQDMITNAESGNLLFGQIWPGHLGYLGAPASDVENAGFVWIDFYDTFGALAIIRPPTKL